MNMAELEKLKFVIKSLLISTPNKITIDELMSDYIAQEGHVFPFRNFGYSTFGDFLQSIPDTVTVSSHHPRYVTPIINSNVKHINDLILKQKVAPKKSISNKSRIQARKSWHSAAYPVPLSEISFTPGWPIKYPSQSRHKKFIKFPLSEISFTPEWPIKYASQSRYKQFPISGYQQGGQSLLKQALVKSSPDRNHLTKIEGPAISKSDHHSSDTQEVTNLTDSVECTSYPTERNLFHDLISMEHSKIGLEKCDGSVKGDLLENVDNSSSSSSGVSSCCSNPSRMFSEKTINNMKTLIKQNPKGIWCSEFPAMYKDYFGLILEYRLYGYVSMVAVASAYPDIFHCVRQNSSDFILFDSEQPLAEHYTRNLNFDSYCPVITNLFRNNLQRMLVNFPCGLKSSELWKMYNEYFDLELAAHNFGFPNTEHLLKKLEEEQAIYLQQVGEDLMVYPHTSLLTQDDPAIPHSPLSHFNVMTEEETSLLASLYPDEAVDWTFTIPQQKWLVEQTHVPVLVSEVCSPSRFYLILEGNEYYSALDSLMAEMQEFYVIEGNKYILPKPAIREGQFCVCPFNGEWHRARICRTRPGTQKVEAYYIDFGTIGDVDIGLLRFLHIDFAKLPMQAIRASLANVKPFQAENWNTEANKLFFDNVCNKTLIAELEKIMEDGSVSVALVDTTGPDDIHINDVLVAEGFAEFERVSFLPLSPMAIRSKILNVDHFLESEFEMTTSSRNSSPSQLKEAGRGKAYLDSCSYRSDYIGIKSISKNASPETYSSICKSVNKTDTKAENSHANITWEGTLPKISPEHLRGNKTDHMDSSSNCNNVSYMPTFITEAANIPADMSKETEIHPFKSIWGSPVSNSTTNLSTTHTGVSLMNEALLTTQVQIPPNTDGNQIDYSKSSNQFIPGWAHSASNSYSQPHRNNNLLTPSVPPGLGFEAMSYNPLNTNSNPLHAVSPQVIEEFQKVLLQQQQQQNLLGNVLAHLLNMCISKEDNSSQNPNISPSENPSVNISGVLTSPNPKPKNIAYESNCELPDNGSIKSFGSQSEQNITGVINVTEIDCTNSDKNVCKKKRTVDTKNKSTQFESYTKKTPSNHLTDFSDEFSRKMSLECRTLQYFEKKDEITRKVIATDEVMPTLNVTADKGVLKTEEEFVCHSVKQDVSKSVCCFAEEKDSYNEVPVKPTRVVKKILIADKFLNLINYSNEPYFCADEVICTFTKLSGTQVVMKILGQNKSIMFVQACRDENADLFKVLDSCDINASCRKPNGKLHDIIHLISLETALKLLKILKVSNETVFAEIEEEIRLFNPLDEYWCPKPTVT